MADHCPLCERPLKPQSEFCPLHTTAHTNVETAFTAWNKAYAGQLTKQEFFTKLEKLSETGQAAIAVIQYLRERKAGQ